MQPKREMRAVDTTKDPMADVMPIGWLLGILAAVLTWVSEIIVVIGLIVQKGSKSEYWEDRYPDWEKRFLTMNNFSHPDSAGLILDQLETLYSFQGYYVAEGLMESMACVAAICCLMALKAQMNLRVPADERELVMYACFVIGLLIPLLEFTMRAGPVSFVGWLGSEVAKDKAGSSETTVFRGFSDTHLQLTMLGLQTTESLFTWLNVVAELLLGLGFLQMSFIGSKKAQIIIDDKTRLLGVWTAGIFFLTALFGILRESSSFVGDEGWILFDLLNTATSVVLGIFLVPTWFFFLGVGLGKVASIEDINRDFKDAVTRVGAQRALGASPYIEPAGLRRTKQAASSFPDRSGAVTADFLSDVFGRRVESFDIKPVGMGFIADAFKVTMNYADGAPGTATAPKTAVVKFGKENEESRAESAPLFQVECAFYRAVSDGGALSDIPITCAKAYRVCTEPEDDTVFCLVMEDCLSTSDGRPADMEEWPGWMAGVPVDVMTAVLCDLTKIHGKYFQSSLLTTLDFLVSEPPEGITMLSPGDYTSPFLGMGFTAYSPFVGAEAAGFTGEDATDCYTMLTALLKRDADKLQFDYVGTDGKTHRMPGGTTPFPHPVMAGEKGLLILKHICNIFATRPQTLMHGDGHPGNVFRDNDTMGFKWIDFQGVHKGPPGMDIAQGLGLGVQGASKEVILQIAKDYYAALVENGPAGLEAEYTFEMLWDDYLCGMLLWYSAYVTVQCQTLPSIWDEHDGGEGRVAGLRMVFPRWLSLVAELELMEYAEKLYAEAQSRK